MTIDNPNASLGTVDCSIYTRSIALKDEYHEKWMEILAYTAVEFNNLHTPAKSFIIPAGQTQFFQENIFNIAPVRRIAIAMKTNSAFTGSYTENPFWYQEFDLRQNRILRESQPIVYFDAAGNCRRYVATFKAIYFQDGNPSVLSDNFKHHFVLVFDLTLCKDGSRW